MFDCVCVVQLEAFEVNVSPELQQQLNSVVQELGVQVPPPVSHLTHGHTDQSHMTYV